MLWMEYVICVIWTECQRRNSLVSTKHTVFGWNIECNQQIILEKKAFNLKVILNRRHYLAIFSQGILVYLI